MFTGNLNKLLEGSKAVVWSLGHSAFAVKTKSHFLIFDYVYKTEKQEKGLSDGYINTAEIEDENVYVFSSHRHGDHYSPHILDWQNQLKNIKYIFGWKARQDESHIRALRHDHVLVDDIEIWTLRSTDEGVGFLIKVDSLFVYHAGDHAYWDEPKETYTNEIDYIAQFTDHTDIAFIPVVQYSGERPENLTQGASYAIEKLKPVIMFPMHGRENGFDYYSAFKHDVGEKFNKTDIICAERRGEIYLYK